MANTPNTIPTKRLAATIDGSATLIKLNNILDWSGTTLTSAYLGDIVYAVLRDQDNTVLEIMQLDPTTIANNSTTGITILRRGLKFNGDLTTEVTANKLVWIKNQTIVEIGTDVPQIFQNYVNVTDAQTIAGVKTFSSFPKKSGSTTPTSSDELATKAYVDATATGSATYDQNIISGTAGETLVSGDFVYFKLSDQRWWKTDADTSSTSINVKIGVSQGSASAGNAVNVLIGGLAKNLSSLTAGGVYYLSSTSGSITTTKPTSPAFVRFVGRAVSSTSLYFDADNDDGTVHQSGQEIYAASTTGNDSYVITLSPAPTALVNGMIINFKADTANTGAATLNVNGLGAKTINKAYNTTLSDSDIKVNQIVTVAYESVTDTFQMLSQVGNDPSATAFDNYIFGDGSDGSATFDGSTTILGMIPSGNVYTLTRDIYMVNATINTGVTINTAGYRIFGTGTLTGNGTAKILRNGAVGGNGGNGGNGSGGSGGTAGTAGTAGSALAAGSVGGALAGSAGGSGGSGGVFSGPGGNGNTGTSAATLSNSVGNGSPASSAGVAGGAGGGTAAGSAASAAAANSVTNPPMMPRVPQWAMAMHYFSGSSIGYMASSNSATGGAGGSGGGGGTNEGGPSGTGGGGGGGGAGGSSGGIVCVAFRIISSPSTSFIQALGGTGGTGGNGGNGVNNGGAQRGGGGGGGGGGTGGTGGVVVCIYKTFTGTSLTEAAACAGGSGGSGGTGGSVSGSGTGVAGTNGNTGTIGNAGKLYLLAL